MSQSKQSNLRPILNDIYTAKDLTSAVSILEVYLASPACVIRASERHPMLARAKQCTTLIMFQQYMTNSFLRYEGLSMSFRKY